MAGEAHREDEVSYRFRLPSNGPATLDFDATHRIRSHNRSVRESLSGAHFLPTMRLDREAGVALNPRPLGALGLASRNHERT